MKAYLSGGEAGQNAPSLYKKKKKKMLAEYPLHFLVPLLR